MRALCIGCRSQHLQRGFVLGPGCLSNCSHSARDVGGQPASSDVSMDGGQSSRWHVQIGVGGWMKHAHESQHGHMSTLLIMTSFQLEFIMCSLFCWQHSNCRGWKGSETESSNGFPALVRAASGWWKVDADAKISVRVFALVRQCKQNKWMDLQCDINLPVMINVQTSKPGCDLMMKNSSGTENRQKH